MLATMKRILLVLVMLLAVSAASAQNEKWNVGIGGGFAIPTGTATNLAKTGFDGFVNATYSITPRIALGLEYSYVYFKGKDFVEDFAHIDHMQMNAFVVKGFYFFSQRNLKPYIALSSGLYNNRIKETVTINGKSATGKGDVNNFGYGVEAGIRFSKLGVGASFNGSASDFHYFLINIGYTFSF